MASLDRLGRSLSGAIRTVEPLTDAQVLLKSLHEGIDYSTATGLMLAGIFPALAGYERELMHEHKIGPTLVNWLLLRQGRGEHLAVIAARRNSGSIVQRPLLGKTQP